MTDDSKVTTLIDPTSNQNDLVNDTSGLTVITTSNSDNSPQPDNSNAIDTASNVRQNINEDNATEKDRSPPSPKITPTGFEQVHDRNAQQNETLARSLRQTFMVSKVRAVPIRIQHQMMIHLQMLIL